MEFKEKHKNSLIEIVNEREKLRDYRLSTFNGFCGCCIVLIYFIRSSTIAPSNSNKSKLPIVPKVDTTIRTKRLMKEFRELQKSQNNRSEKIFSVNLHEN